MTVSLLCYMHARSLHSPVSAQQTVTARHLIHRERREVPADSSTALPPIDTMPDDLPIDEPTSIDEVERVRRLLPPSPLSAVCTSTDNNLGVADPEAL